MSAVIERAQATRGGGTLSTVALRFRDWRPLAAALAVALTYYAGAKVGFALTFDPYPISILWPPNSLLFAALLLAPARWWWLLILFTFPAHLLAELEAGVPKGMVFFWFVSNVSEALIGALFVRRFTDWTPGLGTLRAAIVFCCAGVLAPFFSSFLDAAFVRLMQWGDVDYWPLWRARFLTNMLATFTFVPVVVTWAIAYRTQLGQVTPARLAEAATLLLGLLAVSIVAFDISVKSLDASAALLYLPLPFLLWAAVRFGPPLTSVSFTMVAFLVIWGVGHGYGPFVDHAIHDNAAPIQLFLLSVAVPLLFLAAVIEERKRAESKLRASEERFSTAFKSSPDAIAISRRSDGCILDVNDRWLSLLGYSRTEHALGRVRPLASHAREPYRTKLATLVREVGSIRDLDLVLEDSRGSVREALVSIEKVQLNGEECVINTLRDITEQRQAERDAREQRGQLAHVTRVASLTDFSGALAHELSQPLTAILSNAEAAQRFLARNPPEIHEIRSILTEIVDADKRAAMVIDRLRLLMRKGASEFALLDLNQLVRDVLDFVHSEFVTRNVRVSCTFVPDLPRVNGDRVQLQQLMLNLISNACEAMQSGREECAKGLRVATMRGGDCTAHVIVTDSGPGIAPEQLERIFEPFVTAKENGLGLGLAICRAIARSHGGTLAAEITPEAGATLRLVLPPAAAAAAAS